MNLVSILWDACLPEHFELTSMCKVPPRGGVYFNNVYAHAGDTVSCTTSVMSGYDIWGHGISQLYHSLLDGGNSPSPKARAFPTLPMLLRALGNNTYLMGEEVEWLRFGYSDIADMDASDVDDKADLKKLKTLTAIIGDELIPPFFLHLHLWSAHLAAEVNEIKVQTMDDKLKTVMVIDRYIRELCCEIWRLFPDTKIVLWADHGDVINDEGKIRHASILDPQVQRVWCLYLDPEIDEYQTNDKVHAQADLFKLMGDVFGIAEVEQEREKHGMGRYAQNPLLSYREQVYAGNWRSDMVARYPEGVILPHDEMIEADPAFREHIRKYGYLMPINRKVLEWQDNEWPHPSVIERLKNLGYID